MLDMWDQADQNPIEVKDISSYGWILQENAIGIDWDSAENMAKIIPRGVNAKQAAKGSIVVARKGVTIAQKAAHVSTAVTCHHRFQLRVWMT